MKQWIQVAFLVSLPLLALGWLMTLPAWAQSTPLLLFFDREVNFDQEFQQTLTDLLRKDGKGFKFALLAQGEEKTKQAMAYYEVREEELPIVLILTKDEERVEKRLPQKRDGSAEEAARKVFRQITSQESTSSQTAPVNERINPRDGAVMVYIPVGEFIMGTSDEQIDVLIGRFPGLRRSWFNSEKPQHTVYLDGYWIYKHEVTVAQYRQFCQETGHRMPPTPFPSTGEEKGVGWEDDHPIVNVNYNDAIAYSQWAGVELPTEAQWEKAGRGIDGRLWPWGSEWDSSKCNSVDSVGKTTSVGRYPLGASPYGVMDMAGNVWEWCADWYDDNYYRKAPSHNPPGPARGTWRVLRGGSWRYVPSSVRVANRYRASPVSSSPSMGFRCSSLGSPP